MSHQYRINLTDLPVIAGNIKAFLSTTAYPIVLLTGEMGVGKTTLTRSITEVYGCQQYAQSPTYNLINEYHYTGGCIYHFDLYRIQHIEELEELGFEEIWGKQGIAIIEWWQIAKDYFQGECWHINIEWLSEETRLLNIGPVMGPEFKSIFNQAQ